MPSKSSHLSRSNDPATSHLAAQSGVASGDFSRAVYRAANFVERFPGKTARELSKLAGDDESGVIRKRLPEAVELGLVQTGHTRECTVTQRVATTYYPADKKTIPHAAEHRRRTIRDRLASLMRQHPEHQEWLVRELLERANGNALKGVLSRLAKRCGVPVDEPPPTTPIAAYDRQLSRLPDSLDRW